MHKQGFYEKYIKRFFDIVLSTVALMMLSPIMAGIAMMIKIKLGSPIIFIQTRPGKNGKLFNMYKFRTMTNETDNNGQILSDEKRSTDFGKKLRQTSLDELPELINIIKGDLSIVGPRPQLVRDMLFMTPEQNRRHEVKQGLTGLAQANGRNCISWEDKLAWDVKYVDNISLLMDIGIILKTIKVVFSKEGADSVAELSLDYGDYLLKKGAVTQQEYEENQRKANDMLSRG